MKARDVLNQNNGDVTRQYYAQLSECGILGAIGVALFRAQKRSSRAKDYRPGKWRRAAYDVKQWSIDQVCRFLDLYGEGSARRAAGYPVINWGWKSDPEVLFGNRASWVLYVDLPQGQVSFHAPDRGAGPDYPGEWDGEHKSAERICDFCDQVFNGAAILCTQSAPAAGK